MCKRGQRIFFKGLHVSSYYLQYSAWMYFKFFMIFTRWWRRPNCPDPRSSAKSVAIEISVASGMFYVLLGGIVLAGIVFVVEYLLSQAYCTCPVRRKKVNYVLEAPRGGGIVLAGIVFVVEYLLSQAYCTCPVRRKKVNHVLEAPRGALY